MDEGSHNPTVPLGLDIAWSAFVILWFIVIVVACVSIARSDIDRVGKVGRCAFAVLLPVIGPLAWYFASRCLQKRPLVLQLRAEATQIPSRILETAAWCMPSTNASC